mmetsp:Transcript_5012/g.8307  ORF Transcript_5012/g.8307 Transcript_5012/m.8307 type:complete len:334 (-) Transcript_5012:210-1211(-)
MSALFSIPFPSAAFTPVESGIGGILVGLPVFFMLYNNGKIPGISGIYSNCVAAPEKWRGLFLAGLTGMGALMTHLCPAFFDVSRVLPLPVYALAGGLVGLGSMIQNGCTSGHMLAGVSRLSPRSIAASAVFCTVAIATNYLFGLAPTIGSGILPLFLPSTSTITKMISLVVLIIASYVGILVGGGPSGALSPSAAAGLTSLVSGVSFAVGLAFSGMTRQSKVLGFFNILGGWDPSLLMVLLSGVLPNIILYQTVIKKAPKPLYETEFGIPKGGKIDAKLLTGAAIFGLGWGIGGFCPGPVLVSLMRMDLRLWVTMGAMTGAMVLWKKVLSKYF